MSAIETLRTILVGTAILAAVVALVTGRWLAAAVLAVGVAVHGYATLYLRRLRVARDGAAPGAPSSP